jgi:hypothetical protein
MGLELETDGLVIWIPLERWLRVLAIPDTSNAWVEVQKFTRAAERS